MKAVVVSIGDELLIGQVVNTNAAVIAERLSAAGVSVERILAVGDERGAIEGALRETVGRTGAVILTGGLGPTHDDLTKRALSEFFGLPLRSDPGLRAAIERLLASRGIPWSEAAEEQTFVPEGAALIPNRTGTAAGIRIDRDGSIVVALPGVPTEMEEMLSAEVIPLLAPLVSGPVTLRRTIRTAGITESALARRLGTPDSLPPGTGLAFLPSLRGVRLRIDARGGDRTEAAAGLDAAERLIRGRAGRYIVGSGAEELEEAVGRLLASSGLTLACAESCTGGAIAARLTSVPGCSAWFLGSVVAYSDLLKSTFLGVDSALIAAHGAVSRECAAAMAAGVRRASGAGIGLSVTGIAGPSGGSAAKPVGTVWIGIDDGGEPGATLHSFGEGRFRVVERAVSTALDLLRRRLSAPE